MPDRIQIVHRAPWLIADLGAPMRALSWAPRRSGFVETRRVVWREVRDADLTPELDVAQWLDVEVEQARLSDAVTLLTSRDLAKRHIAEASVGGATAQCLATVGLGNAERVGHRAAHPGVKAGTINILAVLSSPLSDAALIEALSIATEARTLAITEVERAAPAGIATGTGTDCIVIAAPSGDTRHVGKHTVAGEALGRAVYTAVSRGAREWMAENA